MDFFTPFAALDDKTFINYNAYLSPSDNTGNKRKYFFASFTPFFTSLSTAALAEAPPLPVDVTETLGLPAYIIPASQLKLQGLLLKKELS